MTVAPRRADLRANLALALQQSGQMEGAAEEFTKALEHDPRNLAARGNLAMLLQQAGRQDEAAAHYREILCYQPNYAPAHAGLAESARRQGDVDTAVQHFLCALTTKPDNEDVLVRFAEAVSLYRPQAYHASLDAVLRRGLESDGVDPRRLAFAAGELLKIKYDICSDRRATSGESDEALRGDPLTHALLAATFNVHPELELWLTMQRATFACKPPDMWSSDTLSFLSALARQVHQSDFALWSEPEEEAAADHAAQMVAHAFATGTPAEEATQRHILLTALYQPLDELPVAENLAQSPSDTWFPWLRPVIEVALHEPMAERALAAKIPSLGSISDTTSQRVREQYEENPYPRWQTLHRQRPSLLANELAKTLPETAVTAVRKSRVDVLVAGCGTGAHPIQRAAAYRDVRVTAIDLSRRSLAYATRKAQRLKLSNIHFVQMDLLDADALATTFDVVEAVGVLHHMQDPRAGLEILCSVLKPGGLIRLGLYSALARAGLRHSQDRIVDLGLGPNSRDIRYFRRRVLLGEETIGAGALLNNRDFYSVSGCRDRLFHAHEVWFDLPRVKALLGDLDLQFLGFQLPDAQGPQLYRMGYPNDLAMANLDRWAKIERAHPELFLGMYLFWCKKLE
jgi:SAM-dependent methyltransferase